MYGTHSIEKFVDCKELTENCFATFQSTKLYIQKKKILEQGKQSCYLALHFIT